MTITKVFGDNSKAWNDNFVGPVLKLHLTLRSIVLFGGMAFAGAVMVIDSADKMAFKRSVCETTTKVIPEFLKAR